MSYPNGQWPESMFEEIGRGYDNHGLYLHLAPAGTAARWRELRRLGWEKYGVWLVISPGWNVYRPLAWQKVYRAELGIYAAVPGTSSHGMVFNGRPCCAIDVANWAVLGGGNTSLGWARFVALCRIVGFTVDFVTPTERWHIGDFDPLTVPAFAAININPNPVEQATEEDDMPIIYKSGGAHMILAAPAFMEVGGELTQKTGVDGQMTLDAFIAAGAKVVNLDRASYDRVRINILAGLPATGTNLDVIRETIRATLKDAAVNVAIDETKIDAIAKRVVDEQAERLTK